MLFPHPLLFFPSAEAASPSIVAIEVDSSDPVPILDVTLLKKHHAGAETLLLAIGGQAPPAKIPDQSAYCQLDPVAPHRVTMPTSHNGGVGDMPSAPPSQKSLEELRCVPFPLRSPLQVAAFLVLRCNLRISQEDAAHILSAMLWVGDISTACAFVNYAAVNIPAGTLRCTAGVSCVNARFSIFDGKCGVEVSPASDVHRAPLDLIVICEGTGFDVERTLATIISSLRDGDRIAGFRAGKVVISPSTRANALVRVPDGSGLEKGQLQSSALNATATLLKWRRKEARLRVALFLCGAGWNDDVVSDKSSSFHCAAFIRGQPAWFGVRVDVIGFTPRHDARAAFTLAAEGTGVYRYATAADGNLCTGNFVSHFNALHRCWQDAVAASALVVAAFPPRLQCPRDVGPVFTECSSIYSVTDLAKAHARAAALGVISVGNVTRCIFSLSPRVFPSSSDYSGATVFVITHFPGIARWGFTTATRETFPTAAGSTLVREASLWWAALKTARAAVLYAPRPFDCFKAWRVIQDALRTRRPDLHVVYERLHRTLAAEEMGNHLYALLHMLITESGLSLVTPRDQIGPVVSSDGGRSCTLQPFFISEIKQSEDLTNRNTDFTDGEATPSLFAENAPDVSAASQSAQIAPSTASTDDESSSDIFPEKLDRLSSRSTREGAIDSSVVSHVTQMPRGMVDAAPVINPYVDTRWLNLNSTRPVSSSLEALVTRKIAAGSVVKASFSLSLEVCKGEAAYIALSDLPVSLSSSAVERKLLLFCVEDSVNLNIEQVARLERDSREFAFYGLQRGWRYVVVHVASAREEKQWLGVDDLLLSDGIEFVTPHLFVEHVEVSEVYAHSVSLHWSSNTDTCLVTLEKHESDPGSSASVSRSFAVDGTGCNIQDLEPLSTYSIEVRPSTMSDDIVVEKCEIVVATAPIISLGNVQIKATATEDCGRVHVVVDVDSMESCGSQYTAVAVPALFLGGFPCDGEVVVAPGRVLDLEVHFDIILKNTLSGLVLSSRRTTTPFSSVIGPWHCIHALKVKRVTSSEVELRWESTSSSFQLLIDRSHRGGSSRAHENADEFDSNESLCLVVGGRTCYIVSALRPDTPYTARVTGADAVNSPSLTFRTNPLPPGSDDVEVVHSLLKNSLSITFPPSKVSEERVEAVCATVPQLQQQFVSEASRVTKHVSLDSWEGVVSVEIVRSVRMDSDQEVTSSPHEIHVVRDIRAVINHKHEAVDLHWSASASTYTVNMGSIFVTTTEPTARFQLPSTNQLLLPVKVTSWNVAKESTELYFLQPPLPFALSLFSVTLFEDGAEVQVDSSACALLMQDLSERVIADVVSICLRFESPLLPAVLVHLDQCAGKNVMVPLLLNRSADSQLSVVVVAQFNAAVASTKGICCLNSAAVSKPTHIPTPRTFSISGLDIVEITSTTVKLKWQSLAPVCDIVVESHDFHFTARSSEGFITVVDLLPMSTYTATVSGKTCGGHFASIRFVTAPSDCNDHLDRMIESLLICGSTLRCYIPPSETLRDGSGEVLVLESLLQLWSQIPVEWASRADGPSAVSTSLPADSGSGSNDWPHLTFRSSASAFAQDPVDESGDSGFSGGSAQCLRKIKCHWRKSFAPKKRIDIIGMPVIRQLSDSTLDLSWSGSAPSYRVVYFALSVDPDYQNKRVLIKDLTRVRINVEEYRGQLMFVRITSAETKSNALSFSVIIPSVAVAPTIEKHLPAAVTVNIPPRLIPNTHTSAADCDPTRTVGEEYFLLAESTRYSNDGRDGLAQSVVIPLDPLDDEYPSSSTSTTIVFIKRLFINPTTAEGMHCLNPTVDVQFEVSLPKLHTLASFAVADVEATASLVKWCSSSSEFLVTVESPPLRQISRERRAAADADTEEGGDVIAEKEGCRRQIVTSTAFVQLRGLQPGVVHHVSVTGRTCGDMVLRGSFMTLPEFHERSVVLQRHSSGLSCTLLVDFPDSEYMCGSAFVHAETMVDLLDEGNALTESIKVKDSVTFELKESTTTVAVRRTLQCDEESVINSFVSATLLLARIPLLTQLQAPALQLATTNMLSFSWSSSAKARFHVDITPLSTLQERPSGPKHKRTLHSTSPQCVISGLLPSTVYEIAIFEDSDQASLMSTTSSPALLVHDSAPPRAVLRFHCTTAPPKPVASKHQRSAGALTAIFDGQCFSDLRLGVTLFSAVRAIPDNVVFVPVMLDDTAVTLPPPTLPVNGTQVFVEAMPIGTDGLVGGDLTVKEPASPATHRLEHFSVISILPSSPIFSTILNRVQFSDPDVEPVEMIRSISRPQIVHTATRKLEVQWEASQESQRCDVSAMSLINVEDPPQVVRVVSTNVALANLRPSNVYCINFAPSYRDVPCQPLNFIALTAPRRPKPPKLHPQMLNVVFDLKPSNRTAIKDNKTVDGTGDFTLTLSETALVICTQDAQVCRCTTATDFLAVTQPRNVFKSSTTLQRVDLRLRSGKRYLFVFFTSIHHPQALNGIVHSKPTIIEHCTDVFPPQNVHVISSTSQSIVIGWSTLDHGSKNVRFIAECVVIPGKPKPEDPPVRNYFEAATEKNVQDVETSTRSPEMHVTFGYLNPDLWYAFRVRQVDADKCGPWCSPIVAQTLRPPQPVKKISVVGVTPTSIKIRWLHEADPQQGQVSFSVAFRCVDKVHKNPLSPAELINDNGAASKAQNGEMRVFGNECELKGLIPGGLYRIHVISHNHLGDAPTISSHPTITVRTETPTQWRH